MNALSRTTLHTLIGLLFVVSGGLGLIYQVVWFKYLSLFLGNTTYAQTIVLATFMGGLAIGSAWWGKKADTTQHPLRLYAFLEIGIGAYCLFYPFFLEFLKSTFISIVVSSQLPSDGTAVHLLKLLFSLCSLLIPTILMGGTLPILVRFISRTLNESGKNIAVLYFLNSLGAVCGSLLAGFFLIRILGLSATVLAAAGLNILIGGIALFLASKKTSASSLQESADASIGPDTLFSRREVILAVMAAGVSGLASMIYEVTWVRLLIPVLGSSTYSFSLMLVAFISGITIGSLIVTSIVQRIKHLPTLLAWCQAGIVLSMLLVIPLYGRVPYEFWKTASYLVRSEATYPIYLTVQFLFCFSLMIIPTIFLGMSLPVATRIAARGIDVLGKSVGNIFAINTLGTVIGSLSAGLILIPLVGVKHTMEIGIIFNLAAGVVLFSGVKTIPRRHVLTALPLMILLCIVYELFIPNWNKNIMLAGVYRRTNANALAPESYDQFVKSTNLIKVNYYKEGTTATIGVIENRTEDGPEKVLIVNGKGDASSKSDLPTQLLCGQLPCLLHQNPQNVLVVGLGSGVTVGSVLTHPVKQVDCVEIAPEIVEAAAEFNDVNGKPFADPRAHLYIEDALAYVKLTPQKYDVIINEPTNPWIAGVGNLFTTEFFENSKAKMNSGGIMVQWFHLYEMSDELLQMVMRTFKANFMYVSVFQPLGVDIIMLGSDQPFAMAYDKVQKSMERPAVRDDLLRISIPDPATLLSLEILSSKSVSRYGGIGNFNTENLPYLEYSAPGAFFINAGVKQLVRFDERMHCDTGALQIKKYIIENRIHEQELRNIGLYHTGPGTGSPKFGFPVLQSIQKKYPKDTFILKRLIAAAQQLDFGDETLLYSKLLAELEPKNPYALAQYAWLRYTADRRFATALTSIDIREIEEMLKKSISLSSDTVQSFRVRLAEVYYGLQNYEKAVEQYTHAIRIRGKYAGDMSIQDDMLLLKTAKCLNRLGRNDRAFGYAIQAVNINPRNEEARNLIYEMWMRGMNPKKYPL